jgi:hypothetical protein
MLACCVPPPRRQSRGCSVGSQDADTLDRQEPVHDDQAASVRAVFARRRALPRL